MQKRLFCSLVALCLLTGIYAQQRGELVFDSLLYTYDEAEIRAVYDGFDLPEFFFQINYDVEYYKVIYRTPAATGDSLTLASGLVAIPVSDRKQPLLVYNHGSLPYDSVISELTARFDQHLFGVPFGTTGYITVLPDYLGYGATPLDHPHPYLHAKTEATAVVDMLRATKTLCSKVGAKLKEQLFLTGYSQGGHANMALQRELETFHTDEFTVTASASCSGPYDLSGLSRDSLLYVDRFAHPLFITFTALSYQYVYGNVYDELEDVFVDPYPSLTRRIYNRAHPETNLLDSLPYPALSMFQPLFYDDLVTDPEHLFNVDPRDNDVYDWVRRRLCAYSIAHVMKKCPTKTPCSPRSICWRKAQPMSAR